MLAFGGATLLIAVLAGVGGFVPWIRANLTVVVAGLFLYVPAWLLDRRGEDAADHGLTLRPLGRNVLVCLVVVAVVWPPYTAGFHVWQTQLLEGRLDPSIQAYRRFSPVSSGAAGGLLTGGAATLEGRPQGQPGPDELRLWTDGRRQVLEWSELAGRRQYTLTTDGAPRVLRVGPQAGWKPHRIASDSFVLQVDPPAKLLLGGPATPAKDNRVDAERSASWIFWLVVTQLLLVAIPEEFFYRAYLQGALAKAWPGAQRKLLGVVTNPAALVATSALFAMGHYVVGFDPQRLAVFFPSLLFGWMKDATGSIAAAAVFHALCNIGVDLMSKAYVFG